MNMSINIDFGNIWDMLSAIGTIGAVVISLILSFREKRESIKVAIVSEPQSDSYYNISLSKNNTSAFQIEEIGFIKNFKKYSLNSLWNGGYVSIYDIYGNHIDSRKLPFSFSGLDRINISLYGWNYDELLDSNIKLYIKDNNGKYHKSNLQKIIKLRDEYHSY